MQVGRNDLLGGYEAAVTERDQTWKHRWNFEPDKPPFCGLRVGDVGGDAQRQVRDIRERVTWVDSQGRENRKNASIEVLAHRTPVMVAEFAPTDDRQPLRRQRRNQLVKEHRFLPGNQVRNTR